MGKGQLRLLGGQCKGLQLHLPPAITRPTANLLKRKIFDSVQDWSGVYCIDLYAGSGSLGLEALSRGAQGVRFVEANKKVFLILKENIQLVQKNMLTSEGVDISYTCDKAVPCLEATLPQIGQRCCLFIDPPYHEIEEYQQVADSLLKLRAFWWQAWAEMPQLLTTSFLENFPQEKKIWYKLYEHGGRAFVRLEPRE